MSTHPPLPLAIPATGLPVVFLPPTTAPPPSGQLPATRLALAAPQTTPTIDPAIALATLLPNANTVIEQWSTGEDQRSLSRDLITEEAKYPMTGRAPWARSRSPPPNVGPGGVRNGTQAPCEDTTATSTVATTDGPQESVQGLNTDAAAPVTELDSDETLQDDAAAPPPTPSRNSRVRQPVRPASVGAAPVAPLRAPPPVQTRGRDTSPVPTLKCPQYEIHTPDSAQSRFPTPQEALNYKEVKPSKMHRIGNLKCTSAVAPARSCS